VWVLFRGVRENFAECEFYFAESMKISRSFRGVLVLFRGVHEKCRVVGERRRKQAVMGRNEHDRDERGMFPVSVVLLGET